MADGLATVGQGPVGGHEVHRPNLLDAECQGQPGLRPVGLEVHPELPGLGEDVVWAVDGHGLDGRDIERELQGAADPDRASLQTVGVTRHIATAEVRADVHQHRARGQRPVVDTHRVVEWLEGRSGLPIALADDVVLRLEFRAGRGRVVIGAAHIGDQLTGLIVECHERAVAQVLPAQVGHPGLQLLEPERLGGRFRVAALGDDGRGSDPFLADLLEPGVERRRHAQAATLQ